MEESEWFVELEKLKEKPEVEFLGIAVDIRYPCGCRLCQKGKEALEERGTKRNTKQLHIVIAPLTNYNKLQHAFIDMSSRAKVSRKGVWIHAMTLAQIPFKNRKEFEKFLKSNVILFRKTTVGEYCIEKMGLSEETVKQFGNVMNAQVLYPEKVIPKDALELYGLNLDYVRKRAKLFKEAWNRILAGEDEYTVYQELQEKLAELSAEEIEEMFEEEEEEEKEEIESKSKKSKKVKKAKKEETKESEEIEEIEDVEEEEEEEDEEIEL